MHRGTPVRKPHTSTSDLLTWTEAPAPEASSSANFSRPTARSNQPSDGISKVLSGGQITDAEAESLNKRKPCSGFKLKEMNGSNIFVPDSEDGSTQSGSSVGNSNSRSSVRIVKQAAVGISQISFSTEENISPKKPNSLPEVAKQRELSGTIESESDSRTRKQVSNAKSKELSGIDIFGTPAEIPARTSRAMGIKENKDMSEPAPQTQRTSVKVSNPAGGDGPSVNSSKKIHKQKFQELTGNDIFKGDVRCGSGEKVLSEAKLKEMSGNNIFADGKAESRDYFGGVRKPPGGESTIASIFQRETS